MSLIRSRGFTLIELMIAVAVTAILMVIAVPAYSNYIYRANRAVAKTAIMKIYSQQENYFNDRKAFATSLTQLPDWTVSPVYLKKDGSTRTTQGTTTIYKLELKAYSSTNMATCALTTALTSTSQYAILATPVNAQARDPACQLLCYGSAGDKGATGTQSADCWTR